MPHVACENVSVQQTPDYFANWSEEALAAWLASSFENAGELDVRATGVMLTFKGRDPYVIRALRTRFDVGEVVEKLERRPLAEWRISRPDEVRRMLCTIQAYLTSTREAVSQALDELAQIAKREQQRRQRDQEIVALWLSDRSKNSIAQALGVAYPVVTKAIERFKSGPAPPSESSCKAPPGRKAQTRHKRSAEA